MQAASKTGTFSTQPWTCKNTGKKNHAQKTNFPQNWPIILSVCVTDNNWVTFLLVETSIAGDRLSHFEVWSSGQQTFQQQQWTRSAPHSTYNDTPHIKLFCQERKNVLCASSWCCGSLWCYRSASSSICDSGNLPTSPRGTATIHNTNILREHSKFDDVASCGLVHTGSCAVTRNHRCSQKKISCKLEATNGTDSNAYCAGWESTAGVKSLFPSAINGSTMDKPQKTFLARQRFQHV